MFIFFWVASYKCVSFWPFFVPCRHPCHFQKKVEGIAKVHMLAFGIHPEKIKKTQYNVIRKIVIFYASQLKILRYLPHQQLPQVSLQTAEILERTLGVLEVETTSLHESTKFGQFSKSSLQHFPTEQVSVDPHLSFSPHMHFPFVHVSAVPGQSLFLVHS